MNQPLKLLPEWVPQEAIILAWPDRDTDWAPWLSKVRACYIELIQSITQNDSGVLLLIKQTEVKAFLAQNSQLSNVVLIICEFDDTWVRDYAFLTCQSSQGMQPIEYTFNGWGNKFDATADNKVNKQALADLCRLPLRSYSMVCEGGALEIDQDSHLLSTAMCLQNPLRNGALSLDQYQARFAEQLGATQTSIMQHGHLQGDDTDGHIDTLVRFTPHRGLVIQSCQNRPDDPHFASLKALVEECRQRFPEHTIFELPLPFVIDSDEQRLPASYANFLINNEQLICPVYGQPEDDLALKQLASAYPHHKIQPVNSLPLVQQFGSIHCISMQIPVGTLKTEITGLFSQGISIYEK